MRIGVLNSSGAGLELISGGVVTELLRLAKASKAKFNLAVTASKYLGHGPGTGEEHHHQNSDFIALKQQLSQLWEVRERAQWVGSHPGGSGR